MEIRVLGCSGSIARGLRTTSFLVDSNILIDAGTGAGELTLEEMARIDHVFLTHSHLDHIAALPLLLDSVGAVRTRPVRVYALPETIEVLRRHIFNDLIWPDFAVLPQPMQPYMQWEPLVVGEPVQLGDIRIEPLPAAHSVPAVGYAVSGPEGVWAFSGDTAGSKRFWDRIDQLMPHALVIETAFSNADAQLARASAHLWPEQLAAELNQLQTANPIIYITHAKPIEGATVADEICQLLLAFDVFWLKAGDTFAPAMTKVGSRFRVVDPSPLLPHGTEVAE
jgi:ribonuclease BN (tRNA processing enzyme)